MDQRDTSGGSSLGPASGSAAASDGSPAAQALRPRTWLLSLGAWTLVALLVTATVVHTGARSDDFVGPLRDALPAWIAYVILTPPVLALDAWLTSRSRSIWVHVPVLLLGCALFITLQHVLLIVMQRGTVMPWSWIVYAMIVVLGRGQRRRQLLRTRELQAESLRRQLAETRVVALQSRLQPHFLFNTLNAVSATLADDPESARRMLVRLSELLRSVLKLDTPEVPLSADLELLSPYVELQSIRFGERLSVRVDVPDALRSRPVPALLLQPLVENAITHGVAPRAEGGEITVTAQDENGALVVSVMDNGVGVAETAPREGIGLGSLRERIATLYGTAGSVSLSPNTPRGACVRVVIPERAP